MQVYPPPLSCEDFAETFVLKAEKVRHRKFGCASERMRERMMAEEERAQRVLQAAMGKRLREVVQLGPDEELPVDEEQGDEAAEAVSVVSRKSSSRK